MQLIWPSAEAEYFLILGLTRFRKIRIEADRLAVRSEIVPGYAAGRAAF